VISSNFFYIQTFNPYGIVFFGIIVALFFAALVVFLSYVLVPRFYYAEKISPYECGFDPFQDSRSRFEVRFYLVAILFIVFDLEIVFLVPWSVALRSLGLFGFLCGIIFLFVLTWGFIYELARGAVDANQD
jgi:NADH-quinone oxidoreductase subunit A